VKLTTYLHLVPRSKNAWSYVKKKAQENFYFFTLTRDIAHNNKESATISNLKSE